MSYRFFASTLALAAVTCSASADLVDQRKRAFASAPRDQFSWTLQLPTHEMFESTDRGVTTESQFVAELRDFEWRAMVDQANRLKGPSATVTLRHGSLDRYLAISPVGDPNDPNDLAFYLFWGRGTTGEDPRFLPVDDLEKVKGLSHLFFSGEVTKVDHIFQTEGSPMEAAFGLE